MIHGEGFFNDAQGRPIFHQHWLPDDAPRAVAIFVHGLGDHSGRYTNLVNALAPLGFALYALDHIGHGKSAGQRVYVDSFDEYIVTLKQFYDMTTGWQPGLPIFLFAQSMGSLIAALFLTAYPQSVAGAILCSPAAKPPTSLGSATIALGRVASRLAPRVGVAALDASGVSRDPAVVAAYRNDPLVYTGKVTARLGAEILNSMQRLERDAPKITVPLLILQGTADRMVNPEGSELIYRLASSTDKELRRYEGLYHEVFNEPERDLVLHDVVEWLNAHLSHLCQEPQLRHED